MPRAPSPPPAAGSRSSGFSLVELAIVLVVMGLLAGTSAPFLVQRIAREKARATQTEMAGLEAVLAAYYREHLRLPAPGPNNTLPFAALHLPPGAASDEIYAGNTYLYVTTNEGEPHAELTVNGASIGATAAVLISRGRNLRLDLENAHPEDGCFVQWSDSLGFDDLVVTLAQSELEASTSWRREIRADLAVLEVAARLLAENDDDSNGFVDDGPDDPPGDRDAAPDWSGVEQGGLAALTHAGLVAEPGNLVDPWGKPYRWDPLQHRFYSSGPDGTDDGGGGDDVTA